MKLYRPRHTKTTETPRTPVDKTDKTPPTPGFVSFVNAPQGGFEEISGTIPPTCGGNDTPHPHHLKGEKFTKHPRTPVDKTDKTTPAEVLSVLSTPPQGVLQNLEGSPAPWQVALSQVEHLAHKLVELRSEVVRIDIDGRGSRAYRTVTGMSQEQVHQLVRWLLSELSKRYPSPSHVVIIAQGAIRPGELVPNTTLWSWQAEHQHQPDEPAPQLADWAQAVLEGAERWGITYPVLVELLHPEPETKILTRLAESRGELERTLAELSRYEPKQVCLLRPGTTEGEGYDTTTKEWFYQL